VVVILGTFPGPKSLRVGEYYADRQRNRFWSIMEKLVPLLGLDYMAAIDELLQRRIGLWDVIRSCIREGAEDKEIKDPKPNNLGELLRKHPHVRFVLFNGDPAHEYFTQFVRAGLVEVPAGLSFDTLPSSSGNNTRSTTLEKAGVWREKLVAAGALVSLEDRPAAQEGRKKS